GDIKPPKLDLPPMPHVKQTDPLQMFGSDAMVFAALGSLLTRQPATTALNAAAGVIHGFQSRDQGAAKQAFQEWKAATANALKLHDYQMEIYKQAMEGVTRRERLDIAQGSSEEKAVTAALAANMSAFKDNVGLAVLQQGGLQAVQKLQEDRAKSAKAMADGSYEAEKLYAMHQAMTALHESPEWAQMTKTQQADKTLETMNKYGPVSVKNQLMSAVAANAGRIADAVAKGEQPPTLKSLYGLSGPVRAELQARGVNLTKLELEWRQAEKQVTTLNGPQMVRFTGLAKSVVNTIDEVRKLSEQMDQIGVPLINHAALTTYVQTEGNTPKGQLASRYLAAVNTLKEEFANLAQGGYAPTESAWKLANSQINSDYGVRQLEASLSEVQRLINYRIQAIPGLVEHGPGSANRYLGDAALTESGAAGYGGTNNPAAAHAKVTTKEQYDALPSGTVFEAPDGSVRTKP
ncbi:MAG: hypothetical protein ACYC0Z_16880, partial [Acidobacteriaceae bacterium]